MKSQLDFYRAMLFNVLQDIYSGGRERSLDLSRDIDYVSRRLDCEGIQFLTVTLPKLGKALIQGLETGLFLIPEGFKSSGGKSRIPAFLQVFFKSIFSLDGHLLGEPDPFSVQEACQVLFMFYKIDLPCGPDKELQVISKFIETEKSLSSIDFGKADPSIIRGARSLLARLFSGFNPKDILPKHGPGAVASGEKLNEKWSFSTHYHSIHRMYPYYDYFISSRNTEVLDRVRWYRGLRRAITGTAKVVLVPKDSRGPRLISSEPLEYMYLQQGLGRKIVALCERHPITRGFVNFTDQSINGRLAFESSLTREYATLDLEEASDRVTVDLVRLLFPKEIADHLIALRSTHTLLPNGELVALNKFAPMGSALCFPVLALTLYAISKTCVDLYGTSHRNVFVYGDDIVAPTDTSVLLGDVLAAFGLRVNTGKSFSRGFFRESCGTDAFMGVYVNPLRVRKTWSCSPRDPSAFASYWALSGALFDRGFWKTSRFIQEAVETMYGKIPYGTTCSGYINRTISCPNRAEQLNLASRSFKRRWNADLQKWEFRVRSIRSPLANSPISGWPRLLRDLITPTESDPQLVVERGTTKINTSWCSIQ